VILLIVVLWAAGLTATIPLAVLAGIALKVGIDIIDWRFLKRAHRLSGKGAFITYGVVALTVFVDLITAVGLGLFVANVITITRLSDLQADDVKTVTDRDDPNVDLTPEERELLGYAEGRVLLLHLRGNMIFGASRAISRTNSAIEGCESLIVDFTQARHLGVSASLAVEEAILDMMRAGRAVYVVGATGQVRDRLDTLGIRERLPERNIIDQRASALRRAITGLPQEPTFRIASSLRRYVAMVGPSDIP